MRLFEIDKRIEECSDSETGEIIDFEKLDALIMEKNIKIENIALWIKDLEALVKAIEEQEKAFRERKEKLKRKIERLKMYLAYVLNGEKFSTDKCAVSFRKSKAVEIRDEAAIPAEYYTEKVARSVNKVTIAASLKAGIPVAGCELVEHVNPIIK